MSDFKIFRTPIEVRVDYVMDDRLEKIDLEEFLLENGAYERGGFGRIRTVKSHANPGKASLFMCMSWPCYNGWLLDKINSSVIHRKTYRAYKEGECTVIVANKMGNMPTPNNILQILENPFNDTTTTKAEPKNYRIPVEDKQKKHPQPIINVYPKVVVNVDADTVLNKLSFGRGRFLNRSALELSRPNPNHIRANEHGTAPADDIEQLNESDNDEFEVVNEEF